MNNLICNITFSGGPFGAATFNINGRGISSISGALSGFFTTRGSSVVVSDGVVLPITATAASSFLNFNYTPAVSPAPASWAVTP
jgi:hypothetical protein